MSKSKSSAATVGGHDRIRGSAPLHSMAHSAGSTASKGSSRGGAHAKPEQPKAADAPQHDEDFEGETPAIGAATPASEVELIEEEFDLEATPVDAAGDRDSPLAPRRPPSDKEIEEGGGDSMLARYFREMATHPVMGPEEELQTAVEVERAEVDHWVAILSHCPAADAALDSLEKDLPTGEDALTLPQLEELRKMLRTFKKQRNKLTRDQEKKYRSVCASLAKAIRLADSDRLWIAHSEEAARRLGEEPGEEEQEAALDEMAQPEAPVGRGAPHLPATATFKKYVEKMSGAAAHSRVNRST